MSSTEPSESVIVRWLEAGDRGDVEAFDALLHTDVVVHAPRGLSTGSRDAEKQVWLDAVEAMPDLHHEVQEVIAQGDTEMARVVVSGTLQRGRIGEAWEIADVGSLVEQVT